MARTLIPDPDDYKEYTPEEQARADAYEASLPAKAAPRDSLTFQSLSPSSLRPVSDEQQAAELAEERYQNGKRRSLETTLRNTDWDSGIDPIERAPAVAGVSTGVGGISRGQPTVTVSRPKDSSLARDFLASIPGAQRPQDPSQAVAEGGGIGGSVLKTIQGAALPPEHRDELAKALAQKYDPEMAAAMGKSTLLRAKSDLDRGMDTATQAIVSRGFTRPSHFPGTASDPSEADRPVADLMQRRQAATTASQQAMDAARHDPASDESKQMQSIVRGALPKMKLDGLEGMSAAFLEKQFPELAKAQGENDKSEATDILRKLQAEREARLEHKGAKGAGTGVAGGLPGGLSQAALDQAAHRYLTDGTLPAVGMGKQGSALRVAIANRAAELGGNTDLAGAAADYKGNAGSLRKLQTQADSIDAFERTGMSNLDNFLAQTKGVVDTGSPFFNAPLRSLQSKFAGDPRMAALESSRQTAATELAKILSGSTGAGALSDSARHEVEKLLDPNATVAQWASAAKVLRQDMQNRKAATHAQIEEIRGRIGGHHAEQPAAHPQDSEAVTWAKQNPNDPRAQKILALNGG
jgi:hypothetical protein